MVSIMENFWQVVDLGKASGAQTYGIQAKPQGFRYLVAVGPQILETNDYNETLVSARQVKQNITLAAAAPLLAQVLQDLVDHDRSMIRQGKLHNYIELERAERLLRDLRASIKAVQKEQGI